MGSQQSNRDQDGLSQELAATERKVREIREIINRREQEARDKVKKDFEGIALKINDYRRESSAVQSADPNSEAVEVLISEFKEKELERNRLVELYDRLYREILAKEEEKKPTPKDIQLHNVYQKNLAADELRKTQLESDITEAERLARDFGMNSVQQEERLELMKNEILELQKGTLKEKALKDEYETLQKYAKGTPEEAQKAVERSQNTLKDYDEHIHSLTISLEAKDTYECMLGKLEKTEKMNGDRIEELTDKAKELSCEYEELRVNHSQASKNED